MSTSTSAPLRGAQPRSAAPFAHAPVPPLLWHTLLAIATAAVLTAAISAPVAAQKSKATYQAQAVRVDQGPDIDGDLNDGVWGSATLIDAFVQQEPNEGAVATERTEVRLLYDESNLYIGVRAFDSSPSGIIATEMRRDSPRILDEDNFQIILDTFEDSRSGYMFVTSPLGAKLEQQVFEEGEGRTFGLSSNLNRDWNGVWHVSTRQTADGWTAEIAIPLVTLRFPASEVQSWGVNFMRNIRRKNEQVFWAPIPKAYSLTRVSLAGSLQGLQSLNRGLDLRIKPFAVGGGRRLSEDGVVDNSSQGDVGLDVKYGVTAGLNLDLTVKTDFAQAEVDDEQINLTRFALFLPEKREFFLENSGQFNVGTTNTFQRIADLFFSRRIGLSDTGEAIPIIGGARLTGKVGRNNIAVMDIQTDEAFGASGDNFLVARYSRGILTRSKVGAIVINKEATSGDHYNRTFGADFVLAPHPNLAMNGFIAKTSTAGVSNRDMGGHFRAEWLDQSYQAHIEYSDLQKNFNPEVGFVPRLGIRKTRVHLEWNPRPDRWGIRVLEPMVNVTYTSDQNNRLLSRRIHNMIGARMDNGAYLIIWYNDYFERLDEPFALRPDVVVAPGDYNFGEWQFWLTSDPSRRLYTSVQYKPQTFFDGNRTDVSLTLGMRLTDRLSTEGKYTRNDVDLPAGDFVAELGSIRVDFALSPKMTLRTLTQYNSLTEQWSTSARFNYIYRPGSDIYLVFDEVRRDPSGLTEVRDRQVLLKFTYLLSR